MNYLAHAYRFLDDPQFVAGTAVPDWLAVSDRPARIRKERLDGSRLAEGIRRHVHDDAWFHETPAFWQVSGALTERIRALDPDPRQRAWFWGHVVTEMLLDSFLVEEDETRLERYYDALGGLDSERLQSDVTAWTTQPPVRLTDFIDRFREAQFLRCYADDGRLLVRIGQVARRVGLPEPPQGMLEGLPDYRRIVSGRARELLADPG